jgi:hypothetical protein
MMTASSVDIMEWVTDSQDLLSHPPTLILLKAITDLRGTPQSSSLRTYPPDFGTMPPDSQGIFLQTLHDT